jgi:large subunit ribosomal protein L29
MNANDYRAKGGEDLRKELLELRREQFNLRMQKTTGQLGNSARFSEVRKEIARIKTVMTEKKAQSSA